MTKFLKLTFILFLLSGCSIKDATGFWSQKKELDKVKNQLEPLFIEKKILSKEFNSQFSLILDSLSIKPNNYSYLDNNNGYQEYNGKLEKISKYSFSKIDNYEKHEPELVFFENNIIFFDNKGTILSFDHNSKLIWKTNIYSKDDKKLNPQISMKKNNDKLIITDNLSKFYALNIKDGKIIWSKNHKTPFNSQIKIFNSYFFVVDSNNICMFMSW